MKILITGSSGFLGKNLFLTLRNIKEGKDRSYDIKIEEILTLRHDAKDIEIEKLISAADVIFYLAGVNRPKNNSCFTEGNVRFLEKVLNVLKSFGKACPIVFSSSTQALLQGRYANSEYGKSKLKAEELLFEYASKFKAEVYIYRLPNIFGKWCRPNYNSVVATFCFNLANDLPIFVEDRNTELELVYVDNVIREMINVVSGKEKHCCEYKNGNLVPNEKGNFCFVPNSHKVTLGIIADTITYFSKHLDAIELPGYSNSTFEQQLRSTFQSYLPASKMAYPLVVHQDQRGSFIELFRTTACGQFSVNVSKPRQVKGQHWHHSKWEFFIVIQGHGLVEQRKIGTDDNGRLFPVLRFELFGEKPQVVRMLPGYTHNLINLSDTEDLITLMWANEIFDVQKPDTYHENV